MQQDLFDLSGFPILGKELQLRPLSGPVWTGNKARLIQRYLRYFTYITKHGTYIDAFSGPQEPDHPDTWALNLVIDAQPRWLRHFLLFEKDPMKIRHLEELLKTQPHLKYRDIQLFPGDMNLELKKYLDTHQIKDSEATFALLDQHTFECDWSTVKMLAEHKKGGHKIEQFYFFGQGWIDRAVSGLKIEPDARMTKWWGTEEWRDIIKKPSIERGIFLANRFKKELGYEYAYSFPIYERPSNTGTSSGRVMFYMIHASDHPEAPKLMFRAYNYAVAPFEPLEQLEMEFGAAARKEPLPEAEALPPEVLFNEENPPLNGLRPDQ